MNTDSSKPNYDVLGQIAGDAPKPYRHQPIRAFGESEVRIVHSDVKSYAGPSQFERDIHLSQFNDVDLKFGKIVKSPAWPMVNLLIATARDQRTSHLFQVQHDWNTLIGKEIDPLVDDWGRHEFSQEPSPYQILNDAMKHNGPIRAIHDASELSPAEYQARMQDFIKEMSEEELTNARIFRKHVFTPAITPTTCECGKVTGREDGTYDGLMFCQICGTRVKVRERNEEKELLASSLLLPYPVSFFEFMVNDHHWLVEVLEQDDKTAVVKYHFYYEGRWLHASWREYRENPVFKLLKLQVIGALIALESKVAKKSNHEDARPIISWDKEEKRNPVSQYRYVDPHTPQQWNTKPGFVDVFGLVLWPEYWYGAERDGSCMMVLKEGFDPQNQGTALFPQILRHELHAVRSVIEAYSSTAVKQGREQGLMAIPVVPGNLNMNLRVTTDDAVLEILIDRFE